MTRRYTILVALLLATAAVLHADVWSDLGSDESEAKSRTVLSVLSGSVPWFGVQAFKAAAPSVRVALVQKVVAWARTFTATPAFKTLYEAARERERPDPPPETGTYAEQFKKQRQDFDANVVKMRQSVAGQSKEIRDAIESSITEMRAQFDALANDPEKMKEMEAATAEARTAAQATYKEDIQAFDKEHPAAAQSALALRLRHFLEVSATVDFSAKLVPSGDKMIFANPQYEARSAEWKMCFRAGREPVEAARSLVLAWLKEIGG